MCYCPQVRETQALILAPTRELAGQIQKVATHTATASECLELCCVLIDSLS